MKSKLSLIILLFFFRFHQFALAGNDNPFLMPIGEKEALSANSGIARTASPANAIYNPAGIAYLKERRLSVSGSTYALVQAKFEVEQDQDPLSFSSYAAVPNMVASSKKLFGWNFIYGIFSPAALDINAKFTMPSTALNGLIRIAINSKDEEQYLGFGTGRKFNSDWSFGFSLLGHRHLKSELSSFIFTPDGAGPNIAGAKRIRMEVISLLGILGIHHQTNEFFQWGVKLSPPGIPMRDKAEVYSETLFENGGTVTKALEDKSYSSEYPLPWSLGIGSLINFNKDHEFALDLNLQGEENYNTIPGSDLGERTKLRTTLRAQLGYQYNLDKDDQILFGINWAPSTIRSAINGSNESSAPLNFLGFSGGYYFIDENLSIGLGAFYFQSRTDRKFFEEKPEDKTAIDVYGLLVSSSIQY